MTLSVSCVGLNSHMTSVGKTFNGRDWSEDGLSIIVLLNLPYCRSQRVSLIMETITGSLPTSIDSLILPTASNNFSHTLSALKRSRLSIRNRLASIYEDSQFVQKIATSQGLPLVANERCGSWYIPTEKKAGSAYFKSTDGHQGQWKFSLRRLNLQVLGIVGEYSG